MDVREKFVELMCDVLEDGCIGHCNHPPCWKVTHAVDGLIANGVTVRELDGCAYCKEDADGYRLAFGAFSLRNPFHNGEWEIRTGHCNPSRIYFCPMCGRKLPQPPKGE